MIFRQLFDPVSSTYTYLLGSTETKKAILIDGVSECLERDLKVMHELGLTLDYALETHVHADHVTSTGLLKQKTGCKIGVAANEPVEGVDVPLHDGDIISVGNDVSVKVITTPGHTKGCVTFQCNDMLFTGDALLIRMCGRTDFQGGSAENLYDSVVGKLFKFSDGTKVYPGHDYSGLTMSTIGEEKRHNPRLTKNKADFVEFMNNMKLDPPKKIHIALPANLKSGLISPS